MVSYATVDDLTARFPRDLTGVESDQVDTMLQDASFLLSVKAVGLQAAIDGGDQTIITAAMMLTVAMVKRALLAQAAQLDVNPAIDQMSEAWGTFSQSVKFRTDNCNLYLYDSELDYLLGLLRGSQAEAVSMRSPGL